MTALRKILIEEETLVTPAVARTPAAKLYVVVTKELAEAPETAGGKIMNIALFLAAPFIGLAYIVALPVVGFGLLVVLAVRAAAKFAAVKAVAGALKTVGMAVAAPFVGLAFVVFFPFVGLALLLRMAGKAAVATRT